MVVARVLAYYHAYVSSPVHSRDPRPMRRPIAPADKRVVFLSLNIFSSFFPPCPPTLHGPALSQLCRQSSTLGRQARRPGERRGLSRPRRRIGTTLSTLQATMDRSLCFGLRRAFPLTTTNLTETNGQFLLETISSSSWAWFGPISNNGSAWIFNQSLHVLTSAIQLFVISALLWTTSTG